MIDPNLIERMTRNEADIAFQRRVRTIFEWVELREGDRILDIPCGRGFYLKMLRHTSGCRLVGADLDESYLRKAASNIRLDGATALSQADLQNLPFRDNVFDAIICSEGLEHIENDLAGLRELARIAKPGATIVVTVPNANYPFWWDPINSTLEKLFGRHIQNGPLAGIWANHLRLYQAGELRKLIERAGLVIEEERSFTHHCFPFSHNIVYGIGKPLLESGALPDSLARSVDRSRFDEAGRSRNLLGLGVSVLQRFDRKNKPNEPPGRSTVSLCVKCRKPSRAQPDAPPDAVHAGSEPFGEDYFRRWNYADRRLGRFSMYWFARRYYAGLIQRFGPREGKLLELGCGLGDLLALLTGRYDCTGIDVADFCVEETRKRANGARVLLGDAQHLSGFADAEFSGVVALHLVEHLVDPRRTIEEVHRILEPGGLWLFATPDPGYSWRRFKNPQTDAIGKDPTHINVQPPEVWRSWCEKAGFEVVRHFADGLWDVPYIRFVPASLQFAVLGAPSLFQVLTRTTLVPLGMGVNQIVVARKRS